MIASSPSLRLLPPQLERDGGADDEELAQPTIFPFSISRDGRFLSLDDCRTIYRALARDARESVSADKLQQPEIAAKLCLVGQPVASGDAAALRICAGARLVTEAWSSDPDAARDNLRRELDGVGAIVAKIEWLAAHIDDLNLRELCHEA